jgi:copper chaperone CopZ
MNTQQISFALQGMFCANCAITIERALTRLDGVVTVRINYATERATVLFDPARAPVAMMARAVRGAGFDVAIERVAFPPRQIPRATVPRHAFITARVNWQAQRGEVELLAGARGDSAPRARVAILLAQSLVTGLRERFINRAHT